MKKGIIIAIDGYSACGKSTIAKDLAKRLEYTYIDTGAMYRAVTLYCLREGVDPADKAAMRNALEHIQIRFERNAEGKLQTYLNDEWVEEAIRSMEVSAMVSPVATVSEVRRFLVAQQQQMGQAGQCILDGRDIGTVVFPTAELKLFLTASPEERTRRRVAELKAKGQQIDPELVRHNLLERDRIDSTREDSPLMQAADAVVIDNTVLTPEEQLAMIAVLAKLRGA